MIGASWNGARAFTSTAGPGISLMNELLGLAYYSEIPAVVIDVQRVGPSTGMPTRTQQGGSDGMRLRLPWRHQTYSAVSGESSRVLRIRRESFDLAERFQTPVIMLSDLDIGMNDWVVPRLHGTTHTGPIAGVFSREEDLEDCPEVPSLHRRRRVLRCRRELCPAWMQRALT